MLTDLIVAGVGVIERAELRLGPGSSALTGETGAGKTLVVAALGLLLGARTDRGLVRTGSKSAAVEGHFTIPENHPTVRRLLDEGLVDDASGDAEVVLARTVGEDGRNRARINGHLVTLSLLADIASGLVEIAGQHEHHRLASADRHRALLDEYAGALELASFVADTVGECNDVARSIDDARAGREARARELDALDFEVSEIERVGLAPGELERLHADIALLERAETTAGALATARAELSGEGGAVERIASARRALLGAGADDEELSRLAARLDSCSVELGDISDELRSLTVEPDPGALQAAHERMAQIVRVVRKYGGDEAGALDHLQRAGARARSLREIDDDLGGWEARYQELKAAAEDGARRLSEARATSGPRLAAAVKRRLAAMALEDASFEVEISPARLSESGAERVEFRFSANPGEPQRPLGKVASGGELSRVALALHLAAREQLPATVVFDEVDAGVGGRAALEVGRCLAELASTSGAQVVMVTHLPQVAAFADAHYRVVKAAPDGRSQANVARVEGEERIAELSRMLAGLPESERAQEHAQELLALAATGGRA